MNDVANLGVLTLLANAELTADEANLAKEYNFSFVLGEYTLTLPEGYALYDTTREDGTAVKKIKVVETAPEAPEVGGAASVGTAEELQAALAANKNITLTDSFAIDFALNLGDGATLDLNGYTLTLPKAGVTISGNGITIKNGTIACSAKNPQYTLYIAEGTTATIEGVTISNGAIYAKNGAELTLRGNTIKPWASGNASAVYAEGAAVTVVSGTFAGSTHGIFKEDQGGEITVRGGRYDRKNASYKVPLATFVAKGYEVVKTTDGVYKYAVQAKTEAASVEDPTEAPVETPTEAPAEASTEAPVETPTEAPAEASIEAPAEIPAETPAAEADNT